jgi:CubicO group peptidase (beta-lactamase class C family)
MRRGTLALATFAVALWLSAAGCGDGNGASDSRLQAVVDDLTGDVFIGNGLSGRSQLFHVPGSQLTVDSPAEGSRTFVGGVADVASGAPVQADQIQPIGSNTKVVTAVLVMQLVEDGRLRLDQTVPAVAARYERNGGGLSRLVREYPERLREVEIRELLNHTSGLVDCLGTQAFLASLARDPLANRSLVELARFGLSEPPLFRPGAPGRWNYSNTDYMLLGLVLEAVTGEPVGEQMAALFEEAGMDRTRYAPTPKELGAEPLSGELIRGYTPLPSPLARIFPKAPVVDATLSQPAAVRVVSTNPKESGPTVAVSPASPEQAQRAARRTRFRYQDVTNAFSLSLAQSAGGIVTDSEDLATFWRRLFDGQLVSEASLAEMQRTVPTGENSRGVETTWGLGFGHQQIAEGVLWEGSPAFSVWTHLGDIFGYESAGYYVDEEDLVVANVVNAFPLPVGDLGVLSDVLQAETRGD